MTLLRRIARDPLIHFLLAGALLFALYRLVHGPDAGRGADETTIVVDEPALVKYLQYQSNAFQPDFFARQFAAMSPAQKRKLVDDFAREEALVREARAMGLDRVDYVIRQRLIQKMLYLVDTSLGREDAPDETALRRYFADHPDNYRQGATLTFTHVFIDNEAAHPAGGEQAALALKARLTASHARFEDAPAYGDRFPYLQNYVDRSPDFIANQFGASFAGSLGKLRPSEQWQGPIQSEFGWHVVLISRRTPAALPAFENVRKQVADDLIAERIAAHRKTAIHELMRSYDVRLVGLQLPPSDPHAQAKSLSSDD